VAIRHKKANLYLKFISDYDITMNQLPRPPVQLSEKAISELKVALEKEIGKDALNKLSEAEINHIGCLFLTLTALELKIAIREKKRGEKVDNKSPELYT